MRGPCKGSARGREGGRAPVLVHPEAQVGQQVAQDLGVGVVEQAAVPQAVVAALAGAEIARRLLLAKVEACGARRAPAASAARTMEGCAPVAWRQKHQRRSGGAFRVSQRQQAHPGHT